MDSAGVVIETETIICHEQFELVKERSRVEFLRTHRFYPQIKKGHENETPWKLLDDLDFGDDNNYSSSRNGHQNKIVCRSKEIISQTLSDAFSHDLSTHGFNPELEDIHDDNERRISSLENISTTKRMYRHENLIK